MINKNRLADTFQFFAGIDSVSREEAEIMHEIKKILESLGARTHVDNAGGKTGANSGNLIAFFDGNASVEPMLLNAHMDTVEPGRGVNVQYVDGAFFSDGSTILGADDKSAIAIILEALRTIKENNLPCGPLEIVFTICEEIGLLGAKCLDYSLLKASFGYALDASDTGGLITRAPALNALEITVHGKDAHAGSAPEKGVNAICLAAEAISNIQVGRIDYETTYNIGMIAGGLAPNIVPNSVRMKGEVRSHNIEKLENVTNDIAGAFREVVEHHRKAHPEVELPLPDVSVKRDFSATHIPDDHRAVRLAQKAAANKGRTLKLKTSGGGSDANIFFEKGIIAGVLGTGMRDVHTVRETAALEDMAYACEFLLEIIALHAKQG